MNQNRKYLNKKYRLCLLLLLGPKLHIQGICLWNLWSSQCNWFHSNSSCWYCIIVTLDLRQPQFRRTSWFLDDRDRWESVWSSSYCWGLEGKKYLNSVLQLASDSLHDLEKNSYVSVLFNGHLKQKIPQCNSVTPYSSVTSQWNWNISTLYYNLTLTFVWSSCP